MEILSLIVLALFTLTGYSIGAVIGVSGKRVSPQPLDLISILILWVVAFATRDSFGKWAAILIWLGIGVIAGLIMTKIQKPNATAPEAFIPMPDGTSRWRQMWHRWSYSTRKIGDYQSRALIAYLYFTIVLPFGLGYRIFGNPLKTHQAPPDTSWQEWKMSSNNLDDARRQG
jgi:hypothetical protein